MKKNISPSLDSGDKLKCNQVKLSLENKESIIYIYSGPTVDVLKMAQVSFLKHLIRQLNLTDVVVLHDRTENVIKTDTWKGKFDVLISRAAFKLSELLPQAEYFLTRSGKLIALKGPNVDEELALCFSGSDQHKIFQFIQHDIIIPFLDGQRKIIIGEKK